MEIHELTWKGYLQLTGDIKVESSEKVTTTVVPLLSETDPETPDLPSSLEVDYSSSSTAEPIVFPLKDEDVLKLLLTCDLEMSSWKPRKADRMIRTSRLRPSKSLDQHMFLNKIL